MLSGDREENKALKDGFPLFIGGEYDFSFPKAFWKVGVLSSCPSSLKKKIAASLLSEQLGLKSVDNVVRTYLKDVHYSEGDDGRLDLRVREFVTQRMRAFSSQIQVISKEPEKELNRTMSEWALGRTAFSMDSLRIVVKEARFLRHLLLLG